MTTRRKATLKERTTACSCCAHPLSHRHHVWEFAEFGENTRTVSLCPNCHDLYHIIVKAQVEESPRHQKLLEHYIDATSVVDPKFRFLHLMILEDQDEKRVVGRNSALLFQAVEARMRHELGDGIFTEYIQEQGSVGDPVEKGGTLTLHVKGKGRNGQDVNGTWTVTYEGVNITEVEPAAAL